MTFSVLDPESIDIQQFSRWFSNAKDDKPEIVKKLWTRKQMTQQETQHVKKVYPYIQSSYRNLWKSGKWQQRDLETIFSERNLKTVDLYSIGLAIMFYLPISYLEAHEDLWTLLENMTSMNYEERPSIEEVLVRWKQCMKKIKMVKNVKERYSSYDPQRKFDKIKDVQKKEFQDSTLRQRLQLIQFFRMESRNYLKHHNPRLAKANAERVRIIYQTLPVNKGIKQLGLHRVLTQMDKVIAKHPGLPLISVGSGDGLLESQILERNPFLQMYLIDPDPTSYYIYEKQPHPIVRQPDFRSTKQYVQKIRKQGKEENSILLLNWATPDLAYDMEAIRLLKPKVVVVIHDQAESAGSTNFHQNLFYYDEEEEEDEEKTYLKHHYSIKNVLTKTIKQDFVARNPDIFMPTMTVMTRQNGI